ncbi:MAG: hypothetical protein H0U57_07315 [Tatlockia sp.]|nr:hypothetical protein [Tatlockia sp.]
MKERKEKEKLPKYPLKKISPKIPEFAHPFQTWIYKCSNHIVDSLNASLAGKSLGEFLKSANSRLFFVENNKFDQIIRECFFLRLNRDQNMPEQLIKHFVTGGQAAFVLYDNERVFYINHFAEIQIIQVISDNLKYISNQFNDVSFSLEPALHDNSLQFIQELIKFQRPDFVDQIAKLFESSKELKSAEDIFVNIHNLNQFLFLAIKKSPAWEAFCKSHNKKFEKITPQQQDLIAGAFTFKLLSFWINKCEVEGKLDNANKQHFEVISKICSHPNKAEFIKECKTKLKFAIKQQMSNINLVAKKSELEKVNSLLTISDNIYFKLLAPQSSKILYHEVKKANNVLDKVLLELGESQHSKESNLESSSHSQHRNFGLFNRSKSLPKIKFSQSDHSKESTPEPDIIHKNISFSHSTEVSTKPLSAPISIANVNPTITHSSDSLPNIQSIKSDKELIFPNLSKLTSLTKDDSLVSQSRRHSPRPTFSTRISEPEIKKEDFTFNSSLIKPKPPKPKQECSMNLFGQKILATQMGEMSIGDQQYLFFAVPTPNGASTNSMNQEIEEENQIGVFTMTTEKY